MGNKGNGTYRALEARLEAKRYMAETENKERESETVRKREEEEKNDGALRESGEKSTSLLKGGEGSRISHST